MKRVQYEKCATWKECNVKYVQCGKGRHEKSAIWENYNKERVLHEKSATTWKRMKFLKSATWSYCSMKRMLDEKHATWEKGCFLRLRWNLPNKMQKLVNAFFKTQLVIWNQKDLIVCQMKRFCFFYN